MTFYRLAKSKYSDNVPAFNADGLKMINYYHGLENVFVCETDDAFTTALEVIKNDVSTKDFNLSLVRKFFDGHVHPIKIERRDGKDNIVVMDSKGQPFDNLYFTSSLINLQKHLKGDIYYASTEIQKDHHSCYTFTAKILSKMSNTTDLAKELENYKVGESVTNSIKVIECKYPERFAILAQSKEEIRDYMSDSLFHEGGIFKNKEGVGQTFEDKIYKPRTSGGVQTPYTYDENLVPSLLDYFARKYAQKIDEVIERLEPAEVSRILNNQDSGCLTAEKLLNIGAETGSDSLEEKSMSPTSGTSVVKAHSASVSEGKS